jgi:hypothetical protein
MMPSSRSRTPNSRVSSSNPTLDLAARVARALAARSFLFSTEDELQRGLAIVFTAEEMAFERERRLTPQDRADFILWEGEKVGPVEEVPPAAVPMPRWLALEVKVDGSLSAVTRQLHRYAQHPQVDALLLVTTRAQHLRLHGETMNGKPVRVHVVRNAF